MTILNETSRNDYIGLGTTDTYDYTFRIFAATDLFVTLVDTVGVEDELTYLTDYTVTGVGSFNGGTITLTAGNLAAGYGLTVRFRTTLTQGTDLRNQAGFFPEVVEDALDRLTRLDQQQQDELDRSIKLPETETGMMTLPTAAERASSFLGFDAEGDPIAGTALSSAAPVTAAGEALIDDATAGAMIETLRNGVSAEPTVANDDEVLFRDTSAATGKRITLRDFMTVITELPAETAPDILDELAMYNASAATADKITLANLLKVVNGLTEDTTPDKTADYMLSYSTSGAAARKVKLETIIRHEAVRQTVVAGGVDANGQANFLNAGTGLAVDMDATSTPVAATFAAGEDALGPVNYRTRFAADQANYWASLAASNLSYLLLDRDTGTGVISAYKTLVPIQYAAFFDKTLQALLPFSGADASTIITDTYGNTWAAIGNAQIDTSVTIDSQQTLLTDGTGDGITSTAITALSPGGWTIEGKVTFAALPASTAKVTLAHYVNGSGFGFEVYLYNNAGTYQLEISASSNGTSNNIASAVRVNLPSAPTLGTAYHWAATQDKVAGKLYTYWGGVKVNDTAMTTGICAITKASHCSTDAGANSVNGSTAGIRLSPCCRYSAGTTFTPPTLPFSADAEWFDLSEFKWKYGSPTSWAEKQRVAVGEVTTNATVPTGIITYALRGRYASPAATPWPALSTLTSVNHYIGVQPIFTNIRVTNIVSELGYAVGDQIIPLTSGAAGEPTPAGLTSYVNTVSFTTGNSTTLVLPHKTTGANSAATTTSWSYKLTVARGW